MMHKSDESRILNQAKEVLRIESDSIRNLIRSIGDEFALAVDLIFRCRGRVVVMGMGKSGLIGKKISATLSSTGTPALFLHPAEGVHGDLGMITRDDLVLALSYSGTTEEIERILPAIKRMGIKMISITGKPNSKLGKASDVVLNIAVEKEACPYNLVPTSSTTTMLAMGDALAISLLSKRNFKKEDFAKIHPGGVLGKKLLLRVEDVMRKGGDLPLIKEDKKVSEALMVMTSSRLGATCVVDKKGKMVGFFTDGDLRRYLQTDRKILEKGMREVMTRNPRTIGKDVLAIEAARMIRDMNFDNIPVIDKNGKPIGIVDERDLLAEGIS